MAELQKLAIEQPEIFAENPSSAPAVATPESTPPPSVFKDLRPSETRYSLLSKTEL